MRYSRLTVAEAQIKITNDPTQKISLDLLSTFMLPRRNISSTDVNMEEYNRITFERSGFGTLLVCIFFYCFGSFNMPLCIVSMTQATTDILNEQQFMTFANTIVKNEFKFNTQSENQTQNLSDHAWENIMQWLNRFKITEFHKKILHAYDGAIHEHTTGAKVQGAGS